MKYLLDSDLLIDFLTGDPATRALLGLLLSRGLAISVIQRHLVLGVTLPGALGQAARQVHAARACPIVPVPRAVDGDVLFAVNPNAGDGHLPGRQLATSASELAWDAVLASIPNRRA